MKRSLIGPILVLSVLLGIVGNSLFKQRPLAPSSHDRVPASSMLESCKHYFAMLLEKNTAHSPDQMAQRAYRALNDKTLRGPKFVRSLRDWAITHLTYRNGRDYPVVACNISPKANFWAKRALGILDSSSEGSSTLTYDALNKELADFIVQAKAYKQRREQIVDETMTAAAQLLALESTIAAGASNNIVVKYVRYVGAKAAEDAELRLPTMSSVLLHRDRALMRLAATQNIAREMNFEQVKLIKAIENFQAEARYHQSLHPSFPLDAEAVTRLKEVDELYRDTQKGILHSDYHPPSSAWDLLKWTQFHVALGERLKAHVPKWKDSEFKKMVDYVKTLTPEERKRLGIDEALTQVESWSSNRIQRWLKTVRWGNASTAVALGSSGVGGILYGAYQLLDVRELMNAVFAEKWKRNECALKMAEQDMEVFYACMDEYLRLVFPDTYLLDREHLIQAVVDGDFKDPEIQEAVDAVVQEGYKAFLLKAKSTAISRVARNYIDRKNVLNPNFDVVLLEMNDTEFLDFYVGKSEAEYAAKDSSGTFIKLKYPIASANANVRLLLRAMIASPKDQREQYFKSLKSIAIAVEVAEHLHGLLERRSTASDTGGSTQQLLSKSLENARRLLDGPPN